MEQLSEKLEYWRTETKVHTFNSLESVFGEKSIAIISLILMAPSSLPIPTGGATWVFISLTIINSLQLIRGQKKLWIPKRFASRTLPKVFINTFLPKLIKIIKRIERLAKPTGDRVTQSKHFLRFSGLLTFLFCIFALASPPFSGLDTLPSLGVVFISLAILFEDLRFYAIGFIAGFAGFALEYIFVKEFVIRILNHFI